MENFTIEETLDRVYGLLANLIRSGKDVSSLPANAVQQYMVTLADCVDNLAGVVSRLATQQRMMGNEGGYQF
jgi:hypothetical protein